MATTSGRLERDAKLSRTKSVASLRIRERTEELEAQALAPYATRSADATRRRSEPRHVLELRARAGAVDDDVVRPAVGLGDLHRRCEAAVLGAVVRDEDFGAHALLPEHRRERLANELRAVPHRVEDGALRRALLAALEELFERHGAESTTPPR